ncbi:dipeptidase PepE [Elizabethkingia anophelis]|uniref:(Alpha)-aspartyl dipeptidase n=1 Tax=Elizabethkingia anophelis TaxID=1117645 RepID=X5L476_9FLAO|nr:dipeptidase PepE [Elizabethkingia anophelis]AQW99379.1 dipeptidase E [Elizabethkingia anophelis]AQX51703.1 (alpha)-aspartyl dipeptidase [Elizabethkingia anophelis]AQX89925.1 (alpha)-aspartyl dipeptidase [Elizabethkingia anophelis]ASV79245.1 dipeptidase PepE [Elizabethkingia anophelis]EHM7980300.1 dipeptidase PepE [Elizabethkingia anophelis]
MNILLASTSTLFGGQYLEYIREEIIKLFNGADEIIFVPFARPGGISHDEYTYKARSFFSTINIKVKGLHEFDNPVKALNEAKGYFTGGGNTFLLVKTLHEQGLLSVLKQNVESGKPYMGASAGSNIGGLNMRTTNDMPIVYPPSFECMGLVPFNLNPHYLDPNPELHHNGETRETRILEFLTQNDTPVVGLREGNWIRRIGDKITTEGSELTRIFERGKEPYEIEAGSELKF